MLEKRRDYRCAVLKVALLKEGAGQVLIRGTLRFEKDTEGIAFGLVSERDFGLMVLRHEILTMEEARVFIQDAVAGNGANERNLWGSAPFRLWEATGYPHSGWPARLGEARGGIWPNQIWTLRPDESHERVPSGPLVVPGQELVISPSRYLDDWLGLPASSSSDYRRGIAVMLPDFRGAIRRVRIKSVGIYVEVTPGSRGLHALTLRAACGPSHDDAPEVRVQRDGHGYSIQQNGIMDVLWLFLVDDRTGEVVDWAEITGSNMRHLPEVEVEVPEQQVLHLVAQGESEVVEFKRILGEAKEFVETILAFANSDGGKIFLGVSDHGEIVGLEAAGKTVQKAQAWMELYCDPPIDIRCDIVPVEGKQIVQVEVPRGPNRPYMHKENKVIYVRRGATDRMITRIELDEFYEAKGRRVPFHPFRR